MIFKENKFSRRLINKSAYMFGSRLHRDLSSWLVSNISPTLKSDIHSRLIGGDSPHNSNLYVFIHRKLKMEEK